MDERDVEKYLRQRVKALGGFHRKVVYQGRSSSPDDWCFFPDGVLVLVECKTTGETPRKSQEVEFNRLTKQGFPVHVVDSKEKVDAVLAEAVSKTND